MMLDYTQDVDGAVAVLCSGHDFSEALRIVSWNIVSLAHSLLCQISLHNRPDLIESRVHPGLEEAQESFLETFDEMQEQLDKEMSRLEDLRQVRADDSGELTSPRSVSEC